MEEGEKWEVPKTEIKGSWYKQNMHLVSISLPHMLLESSAKKGFSKVFHGKAMLLKCFYHMSHLSGHKSKCYLDGFGFSIKIHAKGYLTPQKSICFKAIVIFFFMQLRVKLTQKENVSCLLCGLSCFPHTRQAHIHIFHTKHTVLCFTGKACLVVRQRAARMGSVTGKV